MIEPGPGPEPVEVRRLDELLAQLELSPEVLRRDPSGEHWLPSEARRLVEANTDCQRALDDFVAEELELWSAFDKPLAPGPDPFFTARVVDSLPEPPSGTRLTPRRRALLLGLFHAVAGVLAYAVLTMVPESTARWAEQAHTWLSWGSTIDTNLWLVGSAVVSVVLVAGLGLRMRTTA